jgi:hypothetical protein
MYALPISLNSPFPTSRNMPTAYQVAHEADKERWMLEKGITEQDVLDLEDAPTTGHDNYKAWSIAKFDHIRKVTQSLWERLTPEERLQTFPAGVTKADELFTMAAGPMDFAFLSTLILHYVDISNGRIGNKPAASTLYDFVSKIMKMSENLTRTRIESTVAGSLYTWISTTLVKETDVHHGSYEKRPFSVDTARSITLAFTSPDFFMTNYRSRLTMTLWSDIHLADSLRIGGLLDGVHKEGRDWVWEDLCINITNLDRKQEYNEITITANVPNAKTLEAQGRELVFTGSNYLWADRVLLVLALAVYAGAFPKGHTYDSLRDPALFGPRSPTIIRIEFAKAASKKPVLTSFLDPEKPLPHDGVRKALRRVSEHCGLDGDLTPHMFRRSGAVAQAHNGKSLYEHFA